MNFIPVRTPSGGTPIGSTYLAAWANCPWEWYNLYLRPGAEGTQGIVPVHTKPAFLKGRIFHTGLEYWYRSGCRNGEDTGEYQIDPALEAARVVWTSAEHEYESPDEWAAHWDQVSLTLRSYHDAYGPGGHERDWPEIRVLCDERGEPLLEREYAVELGYRDFILTCKPDAIVSHRGYVKVLEHKTSHPRYLSERLQSIHTDAQFTQECYTLRALLPELPLEGVLANVMPVPRGASSKFRVAERETTKRSDWDLEVFRLDSIDILQQIDDRVGRWQDLVAGGMNPTNAARMCFPSHGTRTGRCNAYRGCQFLRLCSNKEREVEMLRNYRGRTAAEVKVSREQVG